MPQHGIQVSLREQPPIVIRSLPFHYAWSPLIIVSFKRDSIYGSDQPLKRIPARGHCIALR